MADRTKNLILTIDDLTVSFSRYGKGLEKVELNQVRNLSLDLYEGEILAVVGASGSGKSLLAHAVMGILPKNAKVSGNIIYKGQKLNEKLWNEVRGREIAFIPQSVTYLDPLLTVGQQLKIGADKPQKEWESFTTELLASYGLSEEVKNYYPNQLSGGMARRVLLCIALASNAKVLVADEPTPGLDEKNLEAVMSDFRAVADSGKSVLMITHDINAALKLADRIAVFCDGTILEIAEAENFCGNGEKLKCEYTKKLLRALPTREFEGFDCVTGECPTAEKSDCSSAKSDCGLPEADSLIADCGQSETDCLTAENINFAYNCGKIILEDVNFQVRRGEVVGLTAPSGFGKTTLTKILAGYLEAEHGKVSLRTADSGLTETDNGLRTADCLKPTADCGQRNPVQLIAQHPEKAVNPKWKLKKLLAECGLAEDLLANPNGSNRENPNSETADTDLLKALGIKSEWLERLPSELSGGELQRFCILRALNKDTKFIIADEMTAMLDAVTQAEVWRAVIGYAKKHQIGVVVISHERPLLERLCDRIVGLDKVEMNRK